MTNLYNTFDKENHLQPDFEKSEFDSLDSWDFGWAILQPINIAADKESEILLAERFSPGQKAIYFFWYLDGEVTNGGFIQFFWNDNQKYLVPILEGLKLIGDKKMLTLVEKAYSIYTTNKEKFELEDSQENFENLYNELTEFEDIDTIYYDIHEETMDLIEKYVRLNPSEFVNLK